MLDICLKKCQCGRKLNLIQDKLSENKTYYIFPNQVKLSCFKDVYMSCINIAIRKMICLQCEENVKTNMAPLYLRSVSGQPRLGSLHGLPGLMDVRIRSLFEKTQDSLSVAKIT